MSWQGPHILAVPVAQRMLRAQQQLMPALPISPTFDRSRLAYVIAQIDLGAAQGLLRHTTAANDAALPVEQA